MVTRQSISDVATRLFFERGFDRVTIDEIAEAADVGRMTVFNHFPRKEDMFFDREYEIRNIAFDAVLTRDAGTSPIEALRSLAHRMIERPHPSFPLFTDTHDFVEVALASEALKARARQMRDDFVSALGQVLADAADRPHSDPHALLAAGLIASTWSIAFIRAYAELGKTSGVASAKRVFFELIDRGITGTKAALSETAYV